MQRFMGLLLDVWREACQHIAIDETASRIAPLISERLPVSLLAVHRVDLKRGLLVTLAAVARDGAPRHASTNTSCDRTQLDELLAWGRRDELRIWPADGRDALAALLAPAHAAGELLAGPLLRGTDLAGIVAFVARPGQSFTDVHKHVVRELLGPLNAALENDRVFRESITRREAAEADRHALLNRLGRDKISDAIVGAEGGLRHVMERVEQVARADVPVLLLGETGSGKEVIARAIHTRSDRGKGPFHRVNCGAIPAELVDSELFGHERGSFTGATGTRKGWFERADAGTLFLDEIGELPLSAQVRLLRVTQDGTYERVGGQQVLHCDVRIVAATHRNLQQMVAEGRFREDLWYRIAVFPVHIPPLRSRPEDLSALAAHFARRASRRFGLPALMPTLEDLSLLSRYSWPGNIRELAAVIDRAAILGNGDKLEIAKALGVAPATALDATISPSAATSPHNPAQASGHVAASPATPAPREPHAHTPHEPPPPQFGEPPSQGKPGAPGKVEPLDAAMRKHIEAALHQTRGRIEGPFGAARLLSINPHTLRARMRKLGINWKQIRESARET